MRDVYLVNGQYQPIVNVTSKQTSVIRILHASGARTLVLTMSNNTNNMCNMTLLARDGIFQNTPYLNLSVIPLLPGSRVLVAIYCDLVPSGLNPSVPQIVNFGTVSLFVETA